MKIVYVYHSLALKGGIERIFTDKMNYLVQYYGYDISFITYQQGNNPESYKLDKRIKRFDLDTCIWKLYKYNAIMHFFRNISMRKILKNRFALLLNEIKPDIVVLTTNDFYISECFLDLPYNFIIESHTYIDGILESSRHNTILLKYFSILFDKWHFSKINKSKILVSLTYNDQKYWKKHIISNTLVIPNMVTNYPHEINPYKHRPNRIICAGRLDEKKGFNLLIDAWKLIATKFPTWRIDIFGEGELKNKIYKKISNCHLSNSIKINIPTDNIYNEYENSSIYVMSSLYEGFGLVLIEAMSCGVPCISFDCPNGPAELITHGEDGLLVPLGDIEKLAESIEWMITHEEERLRMSNNARQKAKQYTAEVIMPQWVELFEKVAKQ